MKEGNDGLNTGVYEPLKDVIVVLQTFLVNIASPERKDAAPCDAHVEVRNAEGLHACNVLRIEIILQVRDVARKSVGNPTRDPMC